MEPSNVELAAELCAMVGTDDLLSYLGLPPGCAAADAQEALKKKRGFFQSMQGNPKYRDLAKFFIKNYRALDELLADPAAYLDQTRSQKTHAQLPMLEMVIDSVLADGVVSPQEYTFVRDSAANLGISAELFDDVLRRRCIAAGVPVPAAPPPPVAVPSTQSVSPSMAPVAAPRRRKGAAGQGWWDEEFSQMLASLVPDDTRRLVDLAAGLGWGAMALLPDRPALEYLGLERDADRLQVAERAIRNSPIGSRCALVPGDPEKLPIPDAAVDVVLCVRAFDRVSNTRAVLQEAARVLRPGGRLICVEPDQSSLRAWFDGPLVEVEAALTALARRADLEVAAGAAPEESPGLSAGPTLAARMKHVGLRPLDIQLHPVRESRFEDMESFAERLAGQVEKLALLGQLGGRAPEVAAAMAAIDAAEARAGSAAVGLAATLLPLFVVVGVKG